VTIVEMDWAEIVAKQFEEPERAYPTPGALAQALDPRTVQTPMMDLLDRTLVEALGRRGSNGAGPRIIIATPPQEGKSQRIARWFPLWAMLQDKDLRVAIASYEANVARRWGRAIRGDVIAHPSLGIKVRQDVSAQNEWELEGHTGGVFTAGVGGALTGRPVDLMIIDDPVKDREQADSETYRERAWDWWTDTASTRLSPGAPVILVMTRWHPDDLAGRLLKQGGWELISIPAQAESENDPLGRKVGEFLDSTRRRTQEQWEAIKAALGARTWSALYQQRPTPAEGLVFNQEWIDQGRRVTGQGSLVRCLVSIDPAAKSKKSSDETGIVVVGLDAKGEAWVLDDRSLRGTPQQWGMAAWGALFRWGANEIVVEDNQGGEMVKHVLDTTWVEAAKLHQVQAITPKVTQVTADKSKRIRAESVASLYEAGRVHHADDGTGRLSILESQMTSWTGDGASPDRMDALVHGLRALTIPRKTNTGRGTRTR